MPDYCPNCGTPLLPDGFGPVLDARGGKEYHGPVPKFVDNEEGASKSREMEDEVTLGEMSQWLTEGGYDAIPLNLHPLSLADLNSMLDTRSA